MDERVTRSAAVAVDEELPHVEGGGDDPGDEPLVAVGGAPGLLPTAGTEIEGQVEGLVKTSVSRSHLRGGPGCPPGCRPIGRDSAGTAGRWSFLAGGGRPPGRRGSS